MFILFPDIEILKPVTFSCGFPLCCDCKPRWLKEPSQLCGTNVFGLAETIYDGPTRFKGYSFFNETLSIDLECRRHAEESFDCFSDPVHCKIKLNVIKG
ncbi:hypothetical protein AVEN_37888-1 [Araneus ventricosus]|uniref:Uncharacterized protein n=1 Tax=Araneus ventricosus TaxID=182803 RepID=A0A4Y2WQX1_ARAVE|nr:hypothetical protein AVEN_37888-1 [Araneus ventricosus]